MKSGTGSIIKRILFMYSFKTSLQRLLAALVVQLSHQLSVVSDWLVWSIS